MISAQERLDCIKLLLDDGYDPENLEYCLQAVNQAHRVAGGGDLPKITKLTDYELPANLQRQVDFGEDKQ